LSLVHKCKQNAQVDFVVSATVNHLINELLNLIKLRQVRLAVLISKAHHTCSGVGASLLTNVLFNIKQTLKVPQRIVRCTFCEFVGYDAALARSYHTATFHG